MAGDIYVVKKVFECRWRRFGWNAGWENKME